MFINYVQEDVQRDLTEGPRYTTRKLFHWRDLFCLPLKDKGSTWHKLIPPFVIHRTKLMNCRRIYESLKLEYAIYIYIYIYIYEKAGRVTHR